MSAVVKAYDQQMLWWRSRHMNVRFLQVGATHTCCTHSIVWWWFFSCLFEMTFSCWVSLNVLVHHCFIFIRYIFLSIYRNSTLKGEPWTSDALNTHHPHIPRSLSLSRREGMGLSWLSAGLQVPVGHSWWSVHLRLWVLLPEAEMHRQQ